MTNSERFGIIPSVVEVWLSLVERYVRDVEAVGSNPVTSTRKRRCRKASHKAFPLCDFFFFKKV